MAKMTLDARALARFAHQTKEVTAEVKQNLFTDGVKALAKQYLRSARRNTPTLGVQERTIETGKRKGEVIRTDSEHMKRKWGASKVEIGKQGKFNTYKIRVFNSASYASYVNDGHRQNPGQYVPILGKRLVANFVEGLHITDKAEKSVKRTQERALNRLIAKYTERLK